MTIQTLESYRGLKYRVMARTEAIERIRAEVERTTPRLRQAGGGGSAEQDKLASYVARLEELEALHRETREDYEIVAAEVLAWIDALPAPIDQIARLRYVDGERFCGWEECGERLHYDGSWCWRLLDNILKERCEP